MPPLSLRPAAATDRLLAALCLLCIATLLLALVLGDVHRRRQQSLQEMQLLHRDLHHLLDRPRLLDADGFDQLEALGQDTRRVLGDVDRLSMSGMDARAGQAAEAAVAALGRIVAQRQAFADLAQLNDRLGGEGRPVPGLCAEDASASNMPRLRSIIDSRLARDADATGAALEVPGADSAPQLRRAVQLVESFRTSRGDALAAMAVLARLPVPQPSAGLVRGLGGLGALLAVLATARWLLRRPALPAAPQACHGALPPAMPAPLPEAEADWTLPPAPLAPLAPPAQPPATDSQTAPDTPPPAAAAPIGTAIAPTVDTGPQWLDLVHTLTSAQAASRSLVLAAADLLDAPQEPDGQNADDWLHALSGLADHLLSAREGAINQALAALADGADPGRQAALERLDLHLVAILDGLAQLQDLRSAERAATADATTVPRAALVRLSSELGHLDDQLGVIGRDVAALRDGGADPVA
jgi:hypothetical protein